MTRQEFMQALSDKLSEELSPEEVRSELQYYRGYMDGEMRRGKTEEEVTAELGDPALIAKTLLEAPRETTIFGTPVVQDQMDAYEEGAYQGGNSLSQQEIQKHADEGTIAGEMKRRAGEARETAEEKREKAEERVSEAREAAEEKRKEVKEKVAESREEAQKKREDLKEKIGERHKEESEHHKEESEYLRKDEHDSNPFRTENGEWNWALFAVILAAVMVVVAIIWIIGSIVSATGPAILIILAIILIVYTIYTGSKKGGGHEGRL